MRSNMTSAGTVAALLLLFACGGCSERPQERSSEASAAPQPGSVASTMAPEVDVANRYPAAVMVTTNPSKTERGQVECSGVLIAPRLVLTAASCVCARPRPPAPVPENGASLDSSPCASTAAVTVVAYEPPMNGEALRSQNWEYRGSVQPLASSSAELALVLLESAVKGVAPIHLAETEARVGEPIILVGYPQSTLDRGLHRKRHFSRSEVMKAATPGERAFFTTRSSPRADAGLRGGPCLREAGEGPVLVGILSGEAGEDSLLISAHSHRAWLLQELQQAAQAVGPERGRPD